MIAQTASLEGANFAPAPQDFAERLCVLPNALPQPACDALTTEIEPLVGAERNYVPTHKKGGTIAYETLRAKSPRVTAFYQSPALQRFISDIVKVEVGPTPLHDQSSLSVLHYERPGDHIGWHYDYNFYKGRHFTVLLPILNRGIDGGLSAAKLMVRKGRAEKVIETPPNTLVVFEGVKVLHKVTPIDEGERRIVLSMTFCADSRHSIIQEGMRRVKDTAFFGLRALWS
jgi:2OG-Fe(II) oxygenase superfamily